jgi:hypothetical protein
MGDGEEKDAVYLNTVVFFRETVDQFTRTNKKTPYYVNDSKRCIIDGVHNFTQYISMVYAQYI